MTVAVLVEGLTVEFGRFRALNDLSLAIDYGEVRGVVGPNGAGKTTLLDVISGVSRAKAGRVLFDETMELTRASEAEIARSGVRRKFQKPSVFEALTVRDNVAIGLGAKPGADGPEKVARMLETVGLTSEADRLAGELAHGQKQWLEIAMVVVAEPKVLMLDEPVAGLTDEETERTAALVKALRSPGRAIIVVEHDMDFVERISDRVTVLHEGRTLFEGSMARARADAAVVDVYLGR
ncbi:urea transport system ATP-binding protein [Methylopila capsulata]|uniref:ABC transporter ATP-binding protein n=1 Tax=Methylopila capsulata TaxID=61654 RepID=A0A9W6IUS3_9HYPH|nr:ATP-binding cassette domain-containing protein [Methylopila capsulata]MBM7850377.1 urea transport system ATP-binding protein [Methylopila capsulata]GLK55670.1 ABC transporter ATP-binding protein [Methylopila capsulata]